MKKFYLKNNKIKLIRYIVSYKEEVLTDTLEMKNEIKQFLSTSTELEELLDRLNKKLIVPNIENIDTSLYEVYENVHVSSYEEADKLINPDIEEMRSLKIKNIEDEFNMLLLKGCEIELSTDTFTVSCTTSDLFILENCKKSENYEVFLNSEKVTVEKNDFDILYNKSNEFYNKTYETKNELISKCKTVQSVEELNTISFSS